MEFCSECGSILTYKQGDENTLICKTCGNEKSLKENKNKKIKLDINAKETVKVLGEDVDVRPTTTETCPECGNDKAYYELKQTRSADEAPTRFFTCTECKHTWREYD